ncbi:MAG: hypothetical protein WD844_11550 [Thermoleophilaceae bacterium]
MTGADVVVDPLDCEPDPLSTEWIEGEGHATARRNVEILHEYARGEVRGTSRRIVLRFLVAPAEILGSERVEGIRLVRNELYRDGSGELRARATDRIEQLECGLVFRSIGYRGVALPNVQFDDRRSVIPNEGRRVLDGNRPRPGEFVVGWIKRGPTGVIGTNKGDAQETVDRILEDLEAGVLPEPVGPSRESLEPLLAERMIEVVDYQAWLAIDEHERAEGVSAGRPRVKLCTFGELLDVAQKCERVI